MSQIVYRMEPEYLCDFAPDQPYVPADNPIGQDAVRPIRLEFDAGARGCIIGCYDHFGAIQELVTAWQAESVTGFSVTSMVCRPNQIATQIDPDYQPPRYAEIIIDQEPGGDLHHVRGERQVRIALRAAKIYARFDSGLGGLFIGTESDIYGDSLSDEARAVALRLVSYP